MIAQEAKMIVIVAEPAKAAEERQRNKTEGERAGKRTRAKDRKAAQNVAVGHHTFSVDSA